MLVDAFLETAGRYPATVAVGDAVRTLQYKQLSGLAAVLAERISSETKCQRVGIMLPASAAFPAVFFGSLWASKVPIPLNFLLNAEELSGVVHDALLDTIITVRHFESVVSTLPARAIYLEDMGLRRRMLFAFFRRRLSVPKAHPQDTAVILYTSGTTAQPKGVELTQQNLYSNCVECVRSMNLSVPQTFLNMLPPFHVFGLTGNVLVPALLGATVHCIPRFSPVVAVKTIERQRATVLLAIPSFYAAFLRLKSAKRESFASIKLAISGGEPLPDSVRVGFEDRFGVTLREGYGLTETSPVVALSSLEQYRLGTVGKPLRGVEIRIVDARGVVQPAGHDGEIRVRGHCVMKGYYKKPEETRRVLDAEGWFSTGDLGSVDSDGFLRITGRSKEMLIIGGENVFPREIEAVLESHADVLQAAVIGVPDESRGEASVAFVIVKDGAQVTELELRALAKQSLAGFKVPKRIEIRNDLPKGPTGKILKRSLRQLLE